MNRIRLLFCHLITGLAPMLVTPRLVRRREAVSNEAAEHSTVSNVAGAASKHSFNEAGQLVMEVPYGRFPGKNDRGQRVVQVFDKASAETMAGVFSNNETVLQKVARWLTQGIHRRTDVALYKGHPDDPNAQTKDDTAYGWLNSIVANEESMSLIYDLNDEGKALVESRKFRFFSPRWDAEPVSNNRNEVRPCHLISVGLTNNNNIPVPALSNDELGTDPKEGTGTDERGEGEGAVTSNSCPMCSDSEEERRTVRQKLYLEADATPAQVQAAIEARAASLKQMAADIDALKAQLAEEQAKTTAANDALAASNSLVAEHAATISNLTAERNNAISNRDDAHKARVEAELRQLQRDGKLTPAQFTEQLAACAPLSNSDFATHLDKLAKGDSKMKTSAVTANAAEQRGSMTVSNSGEAMRAKERGKFIADFMQQPRHQHIGTEARRAMAWAECQKQHPEWMP